MNTKKKIVLGILVIIAIASIFLLNIEKESSIIITLGEESKIVEGDFIYNHTQAITFPAVIRSSGEKPVETEYKGVELSQLLSSLDYDVSNINKITLNAEDGYRIIMDAEELKEVSNAYLTFERDGEHLKSRKRNGNGPFQLVIRRDPFSQRWIKHVNKIIIE